MEMKRYIALLRGVNISGRNRVPMAELKKGVEALGFADVKTYLNSGNVVFSGKTDSNEQLARQMEAMIRDRFGLDVPVFVLSQDALAQILDNAPQWWGNDNREIYDNLIFVIPPATGAEVCEQIGEPKAELERILDCTNAIFWSFSRKDYQKTNWWPSTASAPIGDKLTIRTANTVRRIAQM